ncbi:MULTISPECIES: hypothetical protein [Actinomadura]|uniref:Right-handed parallel beta-helix repeat-containing protein n=1 Tax=Actinomadura yumaensis TaxID=111807 RepID=A0ABW2CC38_9ACTN|nr:hypothetical protein [Actinomadura sp. J1-007]
MYTRTVLALALAGAALTACGGDGREAATQGSTGTPSRIVTPTPADVQPTGAPPLKLDLDRKSASTSGGEGAQAAWPNYSTTGVPAGRRLTRTGPLTIRRDGAIVDGKEVHGEINVQANNVTVRNTHVVGAGGDWVVIQRQGYGGLRIERTEINGTPKVRSQKAVLNFGGALTVRGARIHTVSEGVVTPHGLIENSLIMKLKHFPGDHNDAIASPSGPAAGQSLVIRHNVILNPLGQTAAIALWQDFGRAHHATIQRNYLAGGGYAVYGGKGKYGRPTDIKVIGNVFSRRYFKKGGFYGPVTSFDPSGRGNVWRSNVWDDGKPVRP